MRGVIKLKRDFSSASKQKLLGMVSDVEKEKISRFTDWIGDSYYAVQQWMGILSINNYMNNVDAYHKKMIDKNNASKKAINKIFDNVAKVDTKYQNSFSSIKTNLKKWDKFIVQMEKTVNPGNKNFSSDYMEVNLKAVNPVPIDNLISYPVLGSADTSFVLDPKYSIKAEKSILKIASAGLNLIGKQKKDQDATLVASILSYLSSVCGVAAKDTSGKKGAVSNFLSMFKASGKMELGLYKYYEKKLAPFDVMRLDKKFGKTMTGISIATKFASAVDETIDTVNVFKNNSSNAYDKSAQVLEMTGSFFGFGADTYKATLASQKYLRYVNKISSSSNKKIVNQILVDTHELKYTTSEAVGKKISNIGTAVAVADVAVSTVSGGVKRFGEVSKDGKVDLQDSASVGVYGSLSGLNTVASSLTFGVVHFDSENVAKDLENTASDYAKSDNWSAKLIRDQLQKGKWYNNAAAFGISVGAAGCMVGKKAVDGVASGVKTVGSWISTGWNYAIKKGAIIIV